MDSSKNKMRSAALKFNIVGFIALAVGLLMPLFLLIDFIAPAFIGCLTGVAISINVFKAKGYYIQSLYNRCLP